MHKSNITLEYVADLVNVPSGPPARTQANLEEAKRQLQDAIIRRCHDVVAYFKGRPTLLLSGGVDSITVLAALRHIGSNPRCVTVIADGFGEDEGGAARSAAKHFDAEHMTLSLTRQDLETLAADAIQRLDTWELWEVCAAIPLLAIAQQIGPAGESGAVITGGGADVLLAGGKKPPTTASSAQLNDWLTDTVWNDVLNSFTRDRNIPDFHERVLGSDSQRYVHFFQTMRFWDEASRYTFPLLFEEAKDDRAFWVDKIVLRRVAEALHVPPPLAYRTKSPLQRSSGLIDALERCSRQRLAEDDGASAYTDPLAEDPANALARWWLRDLAAANYMPTPTE